jgi:hypothetical protein
MNQLKRSPFSDYLFLKLYAKIVEFQLEIFLKGLNVIHMLERILKGLSIMHMLERILKEFADTKTIRRKLRVKR